MKPRFDFDKVMGNVGGGDTPSSEGVRNGPPLGDDEMYKLAERAIGMDGPRLSPEDFKAKNGFEPTTPGLALKELSEFMEASSMQGPGYSGPEIPAQAEEDAARALEKLKGMTDTELLRIEYLAFAAIGGAKAVGLVAHIVRTKLRRS